MITSLILVSHPLLAVQLDAFAYLEQSNVAESSSRYSKDEDHMAQVIELLGEMPRREFHLYLSAHLDCSPDAHTLHRSRSWRKIQQRDLYAKRHSAKHPEVALLGNPRSFDG